MRYGWSLTEEDWNRLPDGIVRNEKWRAVQLTIGDDVSVPDGPGVYVVCSAPPGWQRSRSLSRELFEFLYCPVYVGRSENLRRRFRQHCQVPKPELQESETLFKGILDFWFIRLETEQISQVESDLIRCFGPPANRVAGILARIGPSMPA